MRRIESLVFTLLVGGVGCGDDSVHHLADAPPGGSADGPIVVIDAPPAPLPTTVLALQREETGIPSNPDAPMAGVVVQVINPDATVGPVATTDATGKVTFAAIEPGSIITATYPEQDDHTRIISVVGVSPGANLVLGDHYFIPDYPESPAVTMTFSWPAQGIPVTVFTPCASDSTGSGSSSLSLTVDSACAGSAMPVQFLSSFGSGNLDTGYIAAAPVAADSTVSLPAWNAFPTAPNFAMTLTGFAATDGVNYANETTPYMSVARTGVMHNYSSGNGIELDGSGNGSANVETALDGLRTTAQLDTYTNLESTDGYSNHHSYRVAAANATSVAFTPTAMPYLGRQVTVSVADKTIAWTESPGATSHGDVAIANVSWYRVDQGADTTHYHELTIIAPPPPTPQLSWASIPAALAAQVPSVDDTLEGSTFELVDIAAVTSYADALKLPEWQWTRSYAAMIDGDVASADVADAGGGSGKAPDRVHQRRVPVGNAAKAAAQAKAYALAHPSSASRARR